MVVEGKEEEMSAAAVEEEKVVAVVVVEEKEEETCSSKYPNLYSRHPCEYHRLCVRGTRNSQLKEGTRSPVDIRLHHLGGVYSPVLWRCFGTASVRRFPKLRHHDLLFYFYHLRAKQCG